KFSKKSPTIQRFLKTLNAISFDAAIGYPPSFVGGPSGYVARFVNQPVAMQHTWLRGISSDGSEPALKGVAIDNSGGPVVVGSFGENYLSDPFSAPMPGLTLPGNHTVVARLDVAGNLQWMNRTTGTDDSGEDVAVAAGKVWVTGDLHGGMLTYLQSGWGGAAAGNPQTSVFVNRLDLLSGLCETGALVDGFSSSVHEARGIAAGNAVFATGGYRGKMEMGIGNPATLQGAGSGATGSPRFAFTIRANTLSGQFNKTGVPEAAVSLEAGMTLFPNPARDVITLSLSDDWKVEGTNVTVYDVSGKVYHTEAINALNHNLDLDGMPAGMYLVSVTNTANGLHETARFVKQ
ncbi:MAG: T9SS type A sorting domain-containing protein, partial [Bacteroidota bacterium]